MKHAFKTLLLFILISCMGWAYADVTTSSTSDSNSAANSNSTSTGGTNTNSNTAGSATGTNTNIINFPSSPSSSSHQETVEYKGTYTMKSTPALYAPPLTTTLTDTCMGSSSIGASFSGFGINGGSTWTDKNCVRRLDSREFRAMGMNDVAVALLCQNPDNQAAVEATGRACPSATPQTPLAATIGAPTAPTPIAAP